MKNLLFIFLLIPFIDSCGTSSKKFNENLSVVIADAEKMVTGFDDAVLRAMENSRYDLIQPHTDAALGKLVTELHRIQEMNKVPKSGINLKNAAENYIETLVVFVKTESAYANYTDTIASEDAARMDKNTLEALRSVETARQRFGDYQRAFIKSEGL